MGPGEFLTTDRERDVYRELNSKDHRPRDMVGEALMALLFVLFLKLS